MKPWIVLSVFVAALGGCVLQTGDRDEPPAASACELPSGYAETDAGACPECDPGEVCASNGLSFCCVACEP